MKLATLNDGTRHGRLLVVSRDLRYAMAPQEVTTLIGALETWQESSPKLIGYYRLLNEGRVREAFELDTRRLAAPMPCAPQWLDA